MEQQLIEGGAELALPKAEVVSVTMAQYLDAAVGRALALEVVNEDNLATAAEVLNSLTKGISAVDKRVTDLRRPVLAFAATISADGKDATALAVQVKAELAGRINEHNDRVEAARQAAIEEQRQAQLAQQRAAAEAARQAEAAQREAERLEWEAQERERLAAEGLASGKRNAATVAQGAADLEAAAKADALAAEAKAKAAEAQRLAEAAAVAQVVETQVVPERVTAKGIKTKKVVQLLSTDVAKLPAAYLLVDEAKLKKHILEGAVTASTPGVVFKVTEVVAATGR